jgi:ATP-dependent exoDNAse (exonuclease V) alpha subunit
MLTGRLDSDVPFTFFDVRDDADAAELAVDLATAQIPALRGCPPHSVWLLTPWRAGSEKPGSVAWFTPRMRERLNPHATQTAAKGLYLADPVIALDNMPDLDVHNGATGRIIGQRSGDDGLTYVGVEFGHLTDTVWFEASEAGEVLAASYANTCHKAQGGQCDHVVVVLPRGSTWMLNQRWLYTAVSRARCSVTAVADRRVYTAAAGKPVLRRTGLAVMLGGGS